MARMVKRTTIVEVFEDDSAETAAEQKADSGQGRMAEGQDPSPHDRPVAAARPSDGESDAQEEEGAEDSADSPCPPCERGRRRRR